MPPDGYLGLVPDPARSLASLLRAWPPRTDAIAMLVSEAETLADEPVHVTARLDQIARDGQTMATAIDTAVDTAVGFHIDPGPTPAILLDGWMAAALAAQERRDAAVASEPHERAAMADRVAELRAELDELHAKADAGAISDNDARLDEVAGRLRRAEQALDDATYGALTPAVAAEINRLGAQVEGATGPGAHGVLHPLRIAIDEVFLDPRRATEVFSLVADGAPVEIAFAAASGNWQGIPGGDPSEYTVDQQRVVTSMLGIELPGDLSAGDIAGIDELFGVLPDDVVAHLFNTGVGYEFAGSVWLSTPGKLVVPGSLSVARQVAGEVELSDPQIGIGFSQTHTVEIAASVTAQGQIRAGKSVLNRVYKIVNRLNRVPQWMQGLLDKSPLLRGVVKGLPFSVSYSRFAGTELRYEATINADQAAALDSGDAAVLPDIFAPEDLAPGNSLLIRGGAIEGSNFALKYKLMYLDETITEFSGLGFGVTRLDESTVAIYSGPIDAIERQTFLGLKFLGRAGFRNTTELATHDFAYAELDLTTPEGIAAYNEFVSGGGVPQVSATGVAPAALDVLEVDSQTGFELGLGSLGVEWEIDSTNVNQSVMTYDSGHMIFTDTRSYGNAQLEFEAPMLPDRTIDVPRSTLTVVVADVSDSSVALLDTALGATPTAETSYVDNHVQLVFSAADIDALRAMARENVQFRSFDEGHYASILELPNYARLVEVLASSDTTAEAMQHIDRFASRSPGELVYQLGVMGFDAMYIDGTEVGSLPGSVSYSPSG